MKKYWRKQMHIRYTKRFVSDIHWEIINTVVSSSATGFHNGTDKHLDNLGSLIRKYERRLRLLKF